MKTKTAILKALHDAYPEALQLKEIQDKMGNGVSKPNLSMRLKELTDKRCVSYNNDEQYKKYFICNPIVSMALNQTTSCDFNIDTLFLRLVKDEYVDYIPGFFNWYREVMDND